MPDFKQHEFLTAAQEESPSTALSASTPCPASLAPRIPLDCVAAMGQIHAWEDDSAMAAASARPQMAEENCVSFWNIHCNPPVLSDLSLTYEFFSSITSGSPKNVGPEIHRHTDDSLASFSLDMAGHHELC